VVEPLIGEEVPVPAALAELLEKPSSAKRLDPAFEALKSELQGLVRA
jgi:threonine synthase